MGLLGTVKKILNANRAKLDLYCERPELVEGIQRELKGHVLCMSFGLSGTTGSRWGRYLDKLHSVIRTILDWRGWGTLFNWKALVQTLGAVEVIHQWWVLIGTEIESGTSRLQVWPDGLRFVRGSWCPKSSHPVIENEILLVPMVYWDNGHIALEVCSFAGFGGHH